MDERPEDDLLEVAPRRRLPRWLVPLLALAVIAGGIVALTHRAGGGHPQSRAEPSTSAASKAITQFGGLDDMVIARGRLYRLASGALYRDDLVGGGLAPDGVLSLVGLDLTQAGTRYHLAAEPTGRWLYVVTFGDAPATVIQIDTTTMQQANLQYWPSQLTAAAVLNGTLYVAANNAVAAFDPYARAGRQVDALPGQYQDVVADPSRHRLLLFGFENGTQRFVAYTPASGTAVRAAAPFGKGALAVVAGAVWAGGFGNSGAVLERLDPGTLKVAAASPLTSQLGPGAVVAGSGAADFWVRSGGGGDGLWCVDGNTGAELEYWVHPGPVASTAGVAFVALGTGARALSMNRCRG